VGGERRDGGDPIRSISTRHIDIDIDIDIDHKSEWVGDQHNESISGQIAAVFNVHTNSSYYSG